MTGSRLVHVALKSRQSQQPQMDGSAAAGVHNFCCVFWELTCFLASSYSPSYSLKVNSISHLILLPILC